METKISREDCWEPTNSSLRQYFSVSSESLSFFFDAANCPLSVELRGPLASFLLQSKPISGKVFSNNQSGSLHYTQPCGCSHSRCSYSRSVSFSVTVNAGISHQHCRMHTSTLTTSWIDSSVHLSPR